MASPCAESVGDMKVWDSELGLQGGERFVKLKRNRNKGPFKGLMQGLYGDHGKENGNYYLGF